MEIITQYKTTTIMKNFKLTCVIIALLITNILQSQTLDVKLGEAFTKWKSDFTFKGNNPKTNEDAYVFNKKINKVIMKRAVTMFYVTVKKNEIISYMDVLKPNTSDIGVPKELVKSLEKFTGVTFSYKNGEYFAINQGIGVTIFRENKPVWGGDRIVMITKLMNK